MIFRGGKVGDCRAGVFAINVCAEPVGVGASGFARNCTCPATPADCCTCISPKEVAVCIRFRFCISGLTPGKVSGVPGEILPASPARMDDIPPTDAAVSLTAVKSTTGGAWSGDCRAEEVSCWKTAAVP